MGQIYNGFYISETTKGDTNFLTYILDKNIPSTINGNNIDYSDAGMKYIAGLGGGTVAYAIRQSDNAIVIHGDPGIKFEIKNYNKVITKPFIPGNGIVKEQFNPDDYSVINAITDHWYNAYHVLAGWTTQAGWHDVRKLPDIFVWLNGKRFRINKSSEYGYYSSQDGKSLIGAYLQDDGGIIGCFGIRKSDGATAGWGLVDKKVGTVCFRNDSASQTNDENTFVVTEGFFDHPKTMMKISKQIDNGIDWHLYDASILNDIVNRSYIKLGYQPVGGGEWLRTNYIPRMGGSKNIQWNILGEHFVLVDGILNGINDVNMLGFHRTSDNKEFWLVGQKTAGDRKVPADGELYLKEGSYAGDGTYRKLKDSTPNIGTFAEKEVMTLQYPITHYSLNDIISEDRTWTGMNGKTFSLHMIQSVGDQNHGGIRNGFNYANNTDFKRSLDCPKELVDFHNIKYREWNHRFAYHNGWATGYMGDSRVINLNDIKEFLSKDGEYASIDFIMTSSHVDNSFDYKHDWYTAFRLTVHIRFNNNIWEWKQDSKSGSGSTSVEFLTNGWPGTDWGPMITRTDTNNFNASTFFGGLTDGGSRPVHQIGMYTYINQGWLTFGYGFNYAEGSGVGMLGIILTDLYTRTQKK